MIYRLLFLITLLCSIATNAQAQTLLVLGDSISAAYGIPVEKGWVSLLQQRLIEQNYSYKVVNASVTGETSLGGKNRIAALLETYQPELVIIELGVNDGLRGFNLKEIQSNLVEIVQLIKQAKSDVLLVPMLLPPNYGVAYNQRFAAIYERISTMMDVTKSQFILQNVYVHPELIQEDRLHPVSAAQGIMLDNVWTGLKIIIKKDNNN